uniref:hypothetical protein n=1 Tax=Acetatifactor sp. TaxID=1872090 RepID=UPI004055A7F0
MGEHNNAMCGFFSHAENCADFWNGILFRGRQEIKPEELEYYDKEYYSTTKVDKDIKNKSKNRTSEQRRDILMRKRSGNCDILLGMELMDTIDYTMPVRKIMYDAQEYQRQMRKVILQNRVRAKELAAQEKIDEKDQKKKYWNNSGEFLYGFHKDDQISPLITVALYCGTEKYDGCNDLMDVLKLEQIETEYRKWVTGYPLHIIILQDLKEEYFQTGLRELIGVMKRSSDKNALLEYYSENKERFAVLDDITIETIGIMIGNTQLIKFKQERGGVDMCKAFEDAKLEGKQEGVCSSIQNLMKNLQMTAEQALETLGVPQGEWEMYLSRV